MPLVGVPAFAASVVATPRSAHGWTSDSIKEGLGNLKPEARGGS